MSVSFQHLTAGDEGGHPTHVLAVAADMAARKPQKRYSLDAELIRELRCGSNPGKFLGKK
ncbi:hypothetical protein DD237_004655 [Peronospora effusa]|uniref:Uncharacterized protein n=1 Tax=Peronospora effusa TaxID=542832 RepID=A0A425C1K2_9STRA|nr:hypothetical protein DD237_004655 [Peronospora effusa]